LFPVFDEPEARQKKGLTAIAITADLRKRLSTLQGAFIIVIPPPAVPGIGTGGGFAIRIQDRQGRGPELLAAATNELVSAALSAPPPIVEATGPTASIPTLEAVELAHIRRVLEVSGGNRTLAAQHLDITRQTLTKRLGGPTEE
jgi:hypothetical protein